MRTLVTGAGGFLGRAVVDALLERGHDVRAMVRPGAPLRASWPSHLDVVRADLRSSDLSAAVAGVDVVLHLAARTSGGEAEQFASTVTGTERLVTAMGDAGTPRLVLASSFTVYDWSAPSRTLDERTPVVGDPGPRGGYTVAKVWQERVARRACADVGVGLTVLRPGVIWGPGNEYPAGVTARIGPAHVIFGMRSRLPLTFAANCADAFAFVAETPGAVGETFNVVDDAGTPTRRFIAEVLARTDEKGRRLVVPYSLAHVAVRGLRWLNVHRFEGRARFPSVLDEPRFVARFRPLSYGTDKLRQLGWTPPVDFEQALDRTYGPGLLVEPRR